MLIGHPCNSIFWKWWSKRYRSGFMCFRTNKRACVLSKSFDLRIFNVRFLSDHSFSLSIFLVIVNHFIKPLYLNSLLCETIPAASYNLRHIVWFTARTIFLWLYLLRIHFIFESFSLQLTTFITYCAVSKRLLSFTTLSWSFQYFCCIKLMNLFLLTNLRWRLDFL